MTIYCSEARQTEFSFLDSFLLFILFFPFKIDYSSTRLTAIELKSTKITMHTVFIARKEKKPIQVPARISKLHAYMAYHEQDNSAACSTRYLIVKSRTLEFANITLKP